MYKLFKGKIIPIFHNSTTSRIILQPLIYNVLMFPLDKKRLFLAYVCYDLYVFVEFDLNIRAMSLCRLLHSPGK